MSRESGLRQRIGALFRANGYFVQAMEVSTGNGVPDMYYRLHRSAVGWLELKQLKVLPAKEETSLFASYNHPLSIEQENWIELELKHGGNADILVGYGRDYFLVPGENCRAFNALTWNTLQQYWLKKENIIDGLSKIRAERSSSQKGQVPAAGAGLPQM
jgi:hypothetical protein